jgi:hypothetical protein
MASVNVTVYGVQHSMPIRANMVWEHQKTKEYYDTLDEKSRDQLDNYLETVGALDLMQQQITRAIKRENYGFVAG